MYKRPQLPDPKGPVTQELMYELIEAAVSSVVCAVRAGCSIEGTLNDFRVEVEDRLSTLGGRYNIGIGKDDDN